MNLNKQFKTGLAIVIWIIPFMIANAQDNKDPLPLPEVITSGSGMSAPSDAIILFTEGSTLDKFESTKSGPALWKVKGSHFTVEPGTGDIQTKTLFGSCQLHIEWRTPIEDADQEGQKSGNSGVYLMGKYEVQVLNSYINVTYADGQAGAIYKQHPPLVNASRKPGEWQVYDIVFLAPEYNEEGNKTKSGYFTVFHNGVLIHHMAEIGDPTTSFNKDLPELASKGPLMLQDHTNKVSYRNIWIRELDN